MRIIQTKEIEFYQDDRGWCIRPISDDDIKDGIVSDIHMVSIRKHSRHRKRLQVAGCR
jgi:hypothetical protein